MIYPKIKRLSALNIIHHQRFDYEFNSFRTDFVGEGGSGKSLISDLLQLIFVGTRAFHSPTQSADDRLPKTMVLKTSGRGTDFGYAFLNIEIDENQFVVIGIYLESNGSSQMFIIQHGHNFSEDSKLIPFDKLLGVNDFVDGDKLLPIEQLKDYILNTFGYTCASWSTTNKYHKILCSHENSIIPVDISKNEKLLNNYSKIIQAFSRESLDISKSDKLKNFLFGDEAERNFERQFLNAVNELSSDVRKFKDNSDEIEKLTNKYNDLVELLGKKEKKESLEKEFLIAKFTYLTDKLADIKKIIFEIFNDFYNSKANLSFLKTLAETKLTKIDASLVTIESDFEKANSKREELRKKDEKVNKFKQWLLELNCSKNKIIDIYKEYHKSKYTIDRINSLQQILNTKKLLSFFISRVWGDDIILSIQEEINTITKNLENKEKLNSVSDIENEKSLAHWALSLDRELSIEEESILRAYQEVLIFDEPENINDQYIPQPEELFENLSIYKTEKDGFWLNLKGIKKFITLTQDPVFNTLNKNEIKEFFKSQSTTLKEEIDHLTNLKGKLKEVQSIFKDLDNPKEYISAWNSGITIDNIQDYDFYKLDEKEFNEYASLFDLSSQISSEYTKAKKGFNNLDTKRSSLKTLKTNLENTLEDFPVALHSENLAVLENKFKYHNETVNNYDPIFNRLSNSENYYKTFQNILKEERKHSNPEELMLELAQEFSDCENELLELSSRYKDTFKKDIQDEKYSEEEPTEIHVGELEKVLNKSTNAYIVTYNTVAGKYMENNYQRYEDTGDFTGLCEEILPQEVFKGEETLDREIIQNIGKRLKDINLKNQQLNGRKLQRLNTIIDEVNAEVSRQLDFIRRIKNFLNSDDKMITGDHKAYLREEASKSYHREWMQDFIDKINEESSLGVGVNLLDNLKSFSKGLEKFTSLEEKMIEAFHRCGGAKSMKPNYKQLLNPKSYYDLSFSIESKKGKNSGSTSQTYSAIALLCIARLSLIEKDALNSKKVKPGVRFMPIDEAEGLGSNFDMLYQIAKDYNYQLLSLSILPNKINKENQNIYLLQNNLEADKKVNYPPIPIFIGSN